MNSNPPLRITSLEVNESDFDFFKSSARAQLGARESGNIAAFIEVYLIFGQRSCPSLDGKLENLAMTMLPQSMGKSSHDNENLNGRIISRFRRITGSDSDESQENLEKSILWIFQGYLFLTHEAEVWAVVEQQHLPKFLSRSSTWRSL